MTTLLVASGGGHLKQLTRLLPRLGVGSERMWVTFDTGLGRSLLQDEDVRFAPYANPHDVTGTARDARFALSLYRNEHIDRVISTGANLAVAFLPTAVLTRAELIYIETATRSAELSLTGRIIDRVPRIHRYVQHEHLANRRWRFGGSVFDGFESVSTGPKRVQRVVVTLGSNETYGFDRLLHRLRDIIPSDVNVLWQTGRTEIDIPGARDVVPAAELEAAMAEADAVIAHSGTGSALSALEAGRLPVLVIRRAAHGEHIDDHQELTAQQLANRTLALAAEADDLSWADVEAAASWTVQERAGVPPFRF